MRVRRRACTRAAIGFAAAVSLASAARGDTANWLNPVNGNWTDASNWSTNPAYPNNVSPTPTYDVTIDAAGANYTVSLNSNITLDSLQLNSPNATLATNSGTVLDVHGPTNLMAGTFLLKDGTLRNTNLIAGANANRLLASGSSTLENVLLNSDVAVSDNSTLTLLNSPASTGGKITLASTTGYSALSINVPLGQMAVLNGSGEIIFDG